MADVRRCARDNRTRRMLEPATADRPKRFTTRVDMCMSTQGRHGHGAARKGAAERFGRKSVELRQKTRSWQPVKTGSMGNRIQAAANVKLLRPSSGLPAVVDAQHAATIFRISQRLPARATLLLDSSSFHVFNPTVPGQATHPDAHQRAVDQIRARYAGKADVLLTSQLFFHSPSLPTINTPNPTGSRPGAVVGNGGGGGSDNVLGAPVGGSGIGCAYAQLVLTATPVTIVDSSDHGLAALPTLKPHHTLPTYGPPS
jgi:hypothetical protein